MNGSVHLTLWEWLAFAAIPIFFLAESAYSTWFKKQGLHHRHEAAILRFPKRSYRYGKGDAA